MMMMMVNDDYDDRERWRIQVPALCTLFGIGG